LWGKRDGWWILRLSGCWGEDSDHTLRGRGIPQVCRALDFYPLARCTAARAVLAPTVLNYVIQSNRTSRPLNASVVFFEVRLPTLPARAGVESDRRHDARISKVFFVAHARAALCPPEMNPSDYRRDYAAYLSSVERERFEYHAGLKRRLDLRPTEERHAELWTRDSVEALRRALEETPEHFETERAGLRALAGAASVRHAEDAASELTEELRRCTESARVDWGGSKVEDAAVPDLLAAERDAARRRELARRWLDASGACEDLGSARLDALDASVRALGFDGRRALYESFTGASLEKFSASADSFLERTAPAFASGLARWSARELPPDARRAPDFADRFFFERAARFDAHFPARGLRALYEETLAGLGVRVESRQNLFVDDEPRPSKCERSACFAVNPPRDVRLVFGARASGLDFFRQTFREGARAQVFAWASSDTATRHPEFIRAPDGATEEGHAHLFSGLFDEPAWLAAARGIRATEAGEAARFSALLGLYETRRACARLRWALALEAADDKRSERLAEEYVSTFDEATGFRHRAAARLADADEWFESATELRARLFAVGLREHLRERHGRRWVHSRAAGEELIDLWNTASRYPAEELARLAWGGEPDFDLLADASLAALEAEDES